MVLPQLDWIANVGMLLECLVVFNVSIHQVSGSLLDTLRVVKL